MPANRAVDFTRGQAVRQILLAAALLIWSVHDQKRIRTKADFLAATSLYLILMGGVVTFIPNVRNLKR